ncbi:hypothetical protein BGZ61DRAFT_538056 [Ilyonectria robusta]|uniref:uncharacterized protein n=1 Tax=Ilyonectria robusta TaxID=1079257 RepID=UPI001E8D641F|nr:uncharacterized protein BGZ61DRAFT_538056 [Ilyonectria robusta]KAH8667885.1 hypothetical protein BGZ61DRAFT_538056 [Ilyonectria robusta]
MTFPKLSPTNTKAPVGAILFAPLEPYTSRPREASVINPADWASPSSTISYVDKLDLEIVRNNETQIIEAILIRGGDSTDGNVLAKIPEVAGSIAVACNDDEHLRTAFAMVQKHSSSGLVQGIVFPTGKAYFDRATQKPNVTIARGGIELLVHLGIFGDELYSNLTPMMA